MLENYSRNRSGFSKARMASIESALHCIDTPEAADEQYARVTISARGRFMMTDKSEHDCVVEAMSPFDAVISCGIRPRFGERIVAYLDYIGRVEGQVIEIGTRSFIISINATGRKRGKLSAQLTWLSNKHELGLPEDRRHERVAPSNTASELKLDNGNRYPCRITDLSVSGAAVEIDVHPALGTPIELGNMRGRVVRHFQEGIAVEFVATLPKETIDKLSWRGGIGEVEIRA